VGEDGNPITSLSTISGSCLVDDCAPLASSSGQSPSSLIFASINAEADSNGTVLHIRSTLAPNLVRTSVTCNLCEREKVLVAGLNNMSDTLCEVA